MNDGDLPLPKAWTLARRKDQRCVYLALAFTAAWLVLVLIIPPTDGEAGLVKGIGLVLLLLFLLADAYGVMQIVARRRAIRMRVRSVRLLKRGHQALLIPESTGAQMLRIVTVVVFATWFFGGWLFGNIVSDTSGYRGAIGGALWNLYVFLGPVLAIATLATIPAHFILRKRSELGIGLSRDGVYNWTWFRCVHYRWEWVSEVLPSRSAAATLVINEKDDWRDVRTDPEENWLAEYDGARRAMRMIRLDHLACSPAVAYYALCFYLRHPELREELGDERGVERIRRCDFPDVIEETRDAGRVWWFGTA